MADSKIKAGNTKDQPNAFPVVPEVRNVKKKTKPYYATQQVKAMTLIYITNLKLIMMGPCQRTQEILKELLMISNNMNKEDKIILTIK